jgi:charged multivesicular body protein 5
MVRRKLTKECSYYVLFVAVKIGARRYCTSLSFQKLFSCLYNALFVFSIDATTTAKILALDRELKGYRDKIQTTKNAAAKKNLQKRALEVLKRKRMYENQRDQLAGQQFNIDQVAFGIDSAKATVSTVQAMKAANVELKSTLRKDLNINDIDELADDMAELMDEFSEINEAMGQNFATPDDIDEADLEAELEMLGDEFEDADLESADAVPSYLQESAPATSSAVMPPTPTVAPGAKIPLAASGQKVDEYGLPL